MTRTWQAVLLEAVILLAAGVILALLANQLSPRGLSLERDYFARSGPISKTLTNEAAAGPKRQESDEVVERLRSKGLSVVGTKEVEQLFHDPQYEQEVIVFLDARDDTHYQEGHIPGAYQFDRYYPEKYFPAVLPASLNATKIVVYCTGGKCEDSEFAALALVDAGIPANRISVYIGGITQWTAEKLPLETGVRKSGVLKL